MFCGSGERQNSDSSGKLWVGLENHVYGFCDWGSLEFSQRDTKVLPESGMKPCRRCRVEMLDSYTIDSISFLEVVEWIAFSCLRSFSGNLAKLSGVSVGWFGGRLCKRYHLRGLPYFYNSSFSGDKKPQHLNYL